MSQKYDIPELRQAPDSPSTSAESPPAESSSSAESSTGAESATLADDSATPHGVPGVADSALEGERGGMSSESGEEEGMQARVGDWSEDESPPPTQSQKTGETVMLRSVD